MYNLRGHGRTNTYIYNRIDGRFIAGRLFPILFLYLNLHAADLILSVNWIFNIWMTYGKKKNSFLEYFHEKKAVNKSCLIINSFLRVNNTLRTDNNNSYSILNRFIVSLIKCIFILQSTQNFCIKKFVLFNLDKSKDLWIYTTFLCMGNCFLKLDLWLLCKGFSSY